MADRPRNRPRARVARGGGAGRPRALRGWRALVRRPLVLGAAVVVLVVGGLGMAVALGGGDEGRAPASVEVAGADVSGKDAAGIAAVARRRARALLRESVVITRTDDPSFRIAITRARAGRQPAHRGGRRGRPGAPQPGRAGAVRPWAWRPPARCRSPSPSRTRAVDALADRVTDRVNTDPRAGGGRGDGHRHHRGARRVRIRRRSGRPARRDRAAALPDRAAARHRSRRRSATPAAEARAPAGHADREPPGGGHPRRARRADRAGGPARGAALRAAGAPTWP